MSVSPRLDLVGIVTNDLARSLAFYRTLGLDIPETPADAPHVEFTFDGGLRLAWDALSPSRASIRTSLSGKVDTPSLWPSISGHPLQSTRRISASQPTSPDIKSHLMPCGASATPFFSIPTAIPWISLPRSEFERRRPRTNIGRGLRLSVIESLSVHQAFRVSRIWPRAFHSSAPQYGHE